MKNIERRLIQFVLKPGALEKLQTLSESLAQGFALIDKAQKLLIELRDSEALVIAGDVVGGEHDSRLPTTTGIAPLVSDQLAEGNANDPSA